MSESSIGIYFGFNNAYIGTYQNNNLIIIPSEIGENKIPLFVSFTKGKILISEYAKFNIEKEPKNTIYQIRKLIGKNYDDPEVQKLIKEVSYIIEKDSKLNKPKIRVEYNDEIKSFSPEEIYTIILKQLIQLVLKSIDKIKNIVITIPTYFNDIQRKSIENASKINELDIKLVKESIAACVFYNNNKLYFNKNILVFSMGSSELNISIVELKNSLFKIISNSQFYFGGNDFDNVLTNYCIEQFQEETGYDIRNNKKSIKRLKNECKKAKEQLSWEICYTIDIDNLFNDIDFTLDIMRARIEILLQTLFDKCISFIDKVLKDSNLNKNQINEIILAGGSTNIPKLKETIRNYFSYDIDIKCSINPQKIFAYGATFIANHKEINFNDLSSEEYSESNFTENNEIKDKSILSSVNDIKYDFIPLSLGIDKGNGIMEVIISRNTKIPCKNSIQFYSIQNYDSFCKIYEGERKLVKYNNLLGIISLNNYHSEQISKLIEITFEIDNEYYLLMILKENNIKIISIKIKLN